MAVRDDVSVRFELSPRVIRVAPPSTQISIQDLHDTLRALEDEPSAMQHSDLIRTAGKESLGGGVTVGLTATLRNARLAFDARKLPLVAGTATTGDATGFRLIDVSATFQTDGVQPGMWIVNLDDGSVCSVLVVISETELITDILGGGFTDEWQAGDSYRIWPVIQVEVSGGNLVAVDESLAEIDAVLPTAGTQVVRTSASSATLTDQQLNVATKYLVESLRPTHGAFGEIFFWDPVAGNDTNNGKLPTSAVLTFAAAHALCADGRTDVIFCINETGAQIHVDDRIVVTKNGVRVRGAGGVVLHPLTGLDPAVDVSANDVSIEGFTFVCHDPAMPLCVRAVGVDAFNLLDCAVFGLGSGQVSIMDGVFIDGGDGHRIENFFVAHVSGVGVKLRDTHAFFGNTARAYDCGQWGVELLATGPGIASSANFRMLFVDACGLGGFHVGANVNSTVLTPDCHLAAGMPTTLFDQGAGTHYAPTEVASTVAITTVGSSVPELPQAQPPATPSVAQALALLYMALRNANQSTATERRIKNAAGTVIAKAPLSDNGSVFDQGQLVAGP